MASGADSASSSPTATPTSGPATAASIDAVALVITIVVSAASVVFALTGGTGWENGLQRPLTLASFIAITLVLQLAVVEVYGRGSVSFAGAGLLAVGFEFGVGAAMAAAVLVAGQTLVLHRGKLHRAVFDAAQLGLAASAGTAVFTAANASTMRTAWQLVPAEVAGIVFLIANIGLLSLAMGLSEGIHPLTVWKERFRWMTPYYFVAGPLGLALVVANSRLGLVGLLAFACPPAFMVLSMRQYVRHTERSVEQLRSANAELEVRATRIQKTHLSTIAALARSMEAKDYSTGGHTERVSGIATVLAKRLGYEGEELAAIAQGALLHDIGKIGVPEGILHKPGPLNDGEWKVMKEHPIISEYILQDVDLHPIVLQVVRSSHERIDGTGYPDGLVGDQIPLPARIVLVADAFDALTSDRPYSSARTVSAAMEELRAHAGTQFCQTVVETIAAIYREEPLALGAARLRAVGEAAA